MTERTGQHMTGQGMEGILHELSIGGGWVGGEGVHMARLESLLQKKIWVPFMAAGEASCICMFVGPPLFTCRCL